jgi:hypothetical protein
MEGLKGTAIRLAVRDPGCPQAPVFARARRHPALKRGSSCRWLRPRPPIPAPIAASQHPARRGAKGSRKNETAGTAALIFDKRSCRGDVKGSPGSGRRAGPAASNEGSGLGNKQRCPARRRSRPAILSESFSAPATKSGDLLMSPLGLPGEQVREDPVPGEEQAGIPETGQPRPRPTPRPRRTRECPAQELEDSP